MAKLPTEIAAEIMAAALNGKNLTGSAEVVAKNFETIYATVLKCRKDELATKIEKPAK